MIVVLKGGLGNCLFQVAFGKSVAKARGEEVVFTRNIPDWDPKRCYGLDVFKDDIPIVKDLQEPCLYEWNNTYGFNPEVYDKKWVSFDGQWQTEKYFDKELVRGMFTMKETPSARTLELADEMAGLQRRAAFIHIRRTDYLDGTSSGKPNSDWHPTMSMEYYKAGMELIQAAVEGTKFYVFSDDPEWCKTQFPDLTVIDHNKPGGRLFGSDLPGKEHEDLFLMSMCHNAVIANSTFSWWGAYFGDWRHDRIVVGPKTWFGRELANLETKDILPERWIKL